MLMYVLVSMLLDKNVQVVHSKIYTNILNVYRFLAEQIRQCDLIALMLKLLVNSALGIVVDKHENIATDFEIRFKHQ